MYVKINKRENVFFREIMNLTHNFYKNLQSCQPMQYFTWFWYCKKDNCPVYLAKIILKSLQNCF